MVGQERNILAVTGHRPNKLNNDYDFKSPLMKWIKAEIIKVLEEEKPHYGISGMALGIDTLFSLTCLELNVPLIAAIPCRGQEKLWTNKSQRLYNEILDKAHVVNVLSPMYTKECMQKRNEWMVDKSTKVLAVWDGSSGGTGNCVKYAESLNKAIIRINPNDYKIL